MTSTNIYVGLAEGGKSSIKVPNAPRGCIGEIFGGEANANGKSANGGPDTAGRPKDTHSRLFGVPNRASASARDAQRGTINLSEDRTDSHTPATGNGNGNGNGNHHGHSAYGHAESQSNGHTAAALAKVIYAMRRNPVTGVGIGEPPRTFWRPRSRRDGNPITGDGYKSMNGEINTVISLNGNANPINHNRVPPGGYSSGLW